MKQMDPQEEKQKMVKQIGAFMTIPFVLAVPPVIGWLLGSWLDTWLGTTWLMHLFVVLGFIAGFREFYRIVKKYGDKT